MKAIGIAPLALGAACASRADGETEAAVDTSGWEAIRTGPYAWTATDEDELKDVMSKRASPYASGRNIPFRTWVRKEQPLYKEVVRTAWAFFKEGVQDDASGLVPAPGLLYAAFRTDASGDIKLTNTGEMLIENLCNFDGEDGVIDVEFSVCAYQCGLLAAQKEKQRNPSATEVSVRSFSEAWQEVSKRAHRRARRSCHPGAANPFLGGGC